ncbi:Uncharacterized protein BN1090_A2_01504 [Aneurinibacillus migulanus]|nr:Uncharacterized protein BN1090_A2_01504 [Aneurinibacillus migulanus]
MLFCFLKKEGYCNEYVCCCTRISDI